MILPLLLCGCNQEDDIYEIFDSGEWTLVNYFSQCDWNNLNNKAGIARYKDPKDLEVINSFKIIFKSDGTLQGKVEIGTFTGKWEGNPKNREFNIREIKTNNINSNNQKSQEFINTLKNVSFYQGASDLMQLAPQNKTSYMQFKHLK